MKDALTRVTGPTDVFPSAFLKAEDIRTYEVGAAFPMKG